MFIKVFWERKKQLVSSVDMHHYKSECGLKVKMYIEALSHSLLIGHILLLLLTVPV